MRANSPPGYGIDCVLLCHSIPSVFPLSSYPACRTRATLLRFVRSGFGVVIGMI